MMRKSILDIAKKGRGRPKTTGLGTGILVRMHEQLAALDAWIEKQHEGGLSRPEAIRRLVEIGLEVNVTGRSARKPGQKSRAQELAAKAIDGMQDPSAPAEERAHRRRRLTKGPPEFREDRIDLPKAKGKI
jgi:hypothetical protein